MEEFIASVNVFMLLLLEKKTRTYQDEWIYYKFSGETKGAITFEERAEKKEDDKHEEVLKVYLILFSD